MKDPNLVGKEPPKKAHSNLTKREVLNMLSGWQKRLQLEHWDVSIAWDDPLDEDGFAACWRSKDYDSGKLRFRGDWPTWDRKVMNETLVHELLHLHMRDTEFVIDQLEGMMHRDVDSVIKESFAHHVEGAVDRLARIFVAQVGSI